MNYNSSRHQVKLELQTIERDKVDARASGW